MPEEGQPVSAAEGTPSPSPVAADAVEALAEAVRDLELDGDGEGIGGGGGDGDGEGSASEVEVEVGKGATLTDGEEGEMSVGGAYDVAEEDGVPGRVEAEESEVERAWKAQQEWMEEKEVVKDGAGEDQENDENDEQQEKGDEEKNGNFPYPQRPGETDCAYYLRTGYCGFGANCKFNHPHRWKRTLVFPSSDLLENSQVKEKEKEEPLGSTGKTKCKFYLMPGGCKYGSNCRYMHDRERCEPGLKLNFLGLPMRPGEKECPFYMRTGSCKFGSNCRFHHPNPTAAAESVPVSGYHDNGSSQQHTSSVSQPPSAAWNLQGSSKQSVSQVDTSPSCAPVMLLPHQLHQKPERSGFQAPPNSLHPLEGNTKYPSVQNMRKPTTNVDGHAGQCQTQTEEYTPRPDQPMCQFYMENGICRYKSSCRFHHPIDRLARPPTNVNEHSGQCQMQTEEYPQRPDQPVCQFYMENGICGYKSLCRFHHPIDRLASHSTNVNGLSVQYQMQSEEYPQRPDQPVCQFYMDNGNCRYKSSCRFHHPKDRLASHPLTANGHPSQCQIQTEEYPERPGQPECQFYMENGNCRYKSSCRYHHPKDRLAKPSMCLLSPMGLPLRPDQPVCTYYSRFGICKFGPTCVFNHPMDRASS